jgi:hypothetical protein
MKRKRLATTQLPNARNTSARHGDGVGPACARVPARGAGCATASVAASGSTETGEPVAAAVTVDPRLGSTIVGTQANADAVRAEAARVIARRGSSGTGQIEESPDFPCRQQPVVWHPAYAAVLESPHASVNAVLNSAVVTETSLHQQTADAHRDIADLTATHVELELVEGRLADAFFRLTDQGQRAVMRVVWNVAALFPQVTLITSFQQSSTAALLN